MNTYLSLELLAPISKSKLGRYKAIGIFIVRRNDEILYIGKSSNVYEAASRLFQSKGKLSDININTVTFEIMLFNTMKRCKTVFFYFKDELTGKYNHKGTVKRRFSKHHNKFKKRALEEYKARSIFTDLSGSHKTDN